MATYHFYKQGYDIAFDNFGMATLKKHLDVPAIIASGVAGYSPLAVGGVRTALPSATGFVGGTDILNLFRLPAGFLVLDGGMKITTAGNATTTIDLGIVSATQTAVVVALGAADINYYWDACVTSAVGNKKFDGATGTAWSAEEPFTDLYVTDGTLDITFNTANQLTLIADIWVIGAKVY